MSYVDNRRNFNMQNMPYPLQDGLNSSFNQMNNISAIDKNKMYLNELKMQVNKLFIYSRWRSKTKDQIN
jgi:hypothetical protein